MAAVHGTRVALVTGASSGIGRATALALAEQGFAVAITARREDQLREVAQQITTAGGTAQFIAGDITDAAFRQRLVREVLGRFGRLDVLVNNAGGAIVGTTESLGDQQIRAMFELNVFAPIELTQLALPELKRQRGIIINVASVAARISTPPVGVYSATKYALAGWTEALRRELRSAGVRVSQVNPGSVATEFAESAGMNAERFNQNGITPRRVAQAIARLADHPRREVTVPWVLGPVSRVVQLLPGLVDVGYRAAERIRPDLISTTMGYTDSTPAQPRAIPSSAT